MTQRIAVPAGYLTVSAKETTAVDLIAHHHASGVMFAHDLAGDNLIEEELPDGRLMLRPDPSY